MRLFRTPLIGVPTFQAIEHAAISGSILKQFLGPGDDFVGRTHGIARGGESFVERFEDKSELLQVANATFRCRRCVELRARRLMQTCEGISLAARYFRGVLRRRQRARFGLLGLLTKFEDALQSKLEHQRLTTADSMASAIDANAMYVSP